MKKLNKSGALRAKTRAFLCAITLAMFTSATAFAQEIYRNEGTGVSNCAVQCGFEDITLTVTSVDASKQYVQLKGEAINNKIWVALVVDGSLSISTIDDIPLGRYVIGNTDAVGTARRSHGLTANSDDADIIGSGGLNTASSPCWFNTTEGYVIVGEDYTDDPHHIILFASTAYHNPAQNSAQCYLMCTYDGDRRYYLRDTNPTACGSGTAAKSTWGRVGREVTVTATPTAPATFVEWRDGDGNLISTDNPHTFDGWGPNEVVAVFSDGVGCPSPAPATPTYTVAATVSPVGAGTVTGADTYDEGDDVTLTATPANRRYRFLRWTESASEVATTAAYTINSINAAHTLVAEFEEIPVTLDDNGTSDYYTATLSTFSTETDFQLMRTFYAGMWNTVCFPFALSASQIANSDMSGATFYTLTSVTGDAAEGLDFNVSEVTSLSARTPYLVQVSGANITNPVFEGVRWQQVPSPTTRQALMSAIRSSSAPCTPPTLR